jgi:hypothetical protein
VEYEEKEVRDLLALERHKRKKDNRRYSASIARS